jgi:hypothetical protein
MPVSIGGLGLTVELRGAAVEGSTLRSTQLHAGHVHRAVESRLRAATGTDFDGHPSAHEVAHLPPCFLDLILRRGGPVQALGELQDGDAAVRCPADDVPRREAIAERRSAGVVVALRW